MKKKVQILMSTYNGEKYLREQIDSLLNQDYPNVEILIRDDGSKDDTKNILFEYQKKYKNIFVYYGDNVGVTDSFFDLLKKSDADYVAFCDQDDVWLKEKISRGVMSLEKENEPTMYCSMKILVDSQLNELGISPEKIPVPSFENALVESICTGCTCMMNKMLIDNIKSHIPVHAIIHDWWIYLVATYLGKVIYDEEAYILYRQHDNNTIGMTNSMIGLIKAKINYINSNRGKLKAQLEEFNKLYSEYEEKDRVIRLLIASEHGKAKLQTVFGKYYKRQLVLDQFITRGLFLFNKML